MADASPTHDIQEWIVLTTLFIFLIAVLGFILVSSHAEAAGLAPFVDPFMIDQGWLWCEIPLE